MGTAEYERSVAFPVMVKSLLACNNQASDAASLAEANRAPERVVRLLKSAVAAGSWGDPGWAANLADWRVLASGFFSSLRTRSLFFRLLDDRAFQRVPLRTRIGVVTSSATGDVIGEGAAAKVSKLEVGNQGLIPVKARAMIAVTDEIARDMSQAAQSLVSGELRGAVSDAVDAEFLDRIVDTGTLASTASGDAADDARADLLAMLEEVNTTGAGRLFWAMAPDVANKGSALATTTGADAFPDLSPEGGELLRLPAVVCSAIPAGVLHLIDASGIAADAETITLDTSQHATLEMDTAPAGGASAVQTSLWQANMTALAATAWFGCERVRDNAVASLSDIDWGAGGS